MSLSPQPNSDQDGDEAVNILRRLSNAYLASGSPSIPVNILSIGLVYIIDCYFSSSSITKTLLVLVATRHLHALLLLLIPMVSKTSFFLL